jgi:FMN phosphatase YigB (HAD superfamily)
VNATARPEAEPARAPEARTTDARLTRALSLLQGPDVRALSLDVFDTMVWRRAPEPTDVFPMIASRLQQEGRLGPNITPRVFQKLRIAAEARARARRDEQGKGVEVALRDIYAELPKYVAPASDPDALARIELDVERGVLMPDLDVLELIRFAHAIGKQVIAVSDTYLSEQELRALLDSSFAGEVALDRLYASSDHGVGKTSGMFEKVLQDLQIEPRQLVHVGDHPEADVEAPSKLGIPTVHFKRATPYLEAVREREARHHDPDRPYLTGDAGLTALRGKLLHRTELEQLAPELKPFWAYGAACLGPALTGFAEWVVESTAAVGSAEAHCLMREGELLAELVDGAAGYLGAEVRGRPIWLSRHVCARASIFEGSERELRTLLVRRSPPTVRQLCETLGVDTESSPKLREIAGARLDDVATQDATFAELSSDPELRQSIVNSARVLRERVMEYLRREAGEAARLVLVDLGWGGTIQSLVHQLLRRDAAVNKAEELPIHGLYLVTQELALQRALDGLELYGFLGAFGVPGPEVRSIMRSPEILEQVCMPDVGSQVDLTADLEPVLGESVDERIPQAAHRAAVQAGIRAFQREWARYAVLMPDRRPSLTTPELREQLLAQVTRALVAPTEQEATVFGAWIHDENFGSRGSDLLVGGPDTVRAFRHMEPRDVVGTPMAELYWPFGLAALEDEHLAQSVEAMTTGRLPAEAFYSLVEAGDFDVYYDNGFGLGEGWKETLESKRNRFGLSYARTTVRAEEVRAVRLDPAAAPCVLRVDWIALTCSMRGQAEAKRLVFDSPEALERFTIRGATPLRPKLWLVDGTDPQFELDLRRALGEAPYEVIVECAYAILASAPPSVPVKAGPPRSQAVKRLARQVENRGLPVEPLRRGYRRLRARFRAR